MGEYGLNYANLGLQGLAANQDYALGRGELGLRGDVANQSYALGRGELGVRGDIANQTYALGRGDLGLRGTLGRADILQSEAAMRNQINMRNAELQMEQQRLQTQARYQQALSRMQSALGTGDLYGSQLNNLATLYNAQLQQYQAQRAAYEQRMMEPWERLQMESAILNGIPYTPTRNSTTTSSVPAPNLGVGQGIMGGAAIGYGALKGGSVGGPMGALIGAGLGGLTGLLF